MLKRFPQFVIYLLLLVMPLQSIAAANLLVCNSFINMDKASKETTLMPCHEHLNNTAVKVNNQFPTSDATDSISHKDTCKANCTHCASLCAMTAITSNSETAGLKTSSQVLSLATLPYACVTLPQIQRPPIHLS